MLLFLWKRGGGTTRINGACHSPAWTKLVHIHTKRANFESQALIGMGNEVIPVFIETQCFLHFFPRRCISCVD
uniref:Secreted protein n=1 Tax=Caenorhabditis tropicalis TaxID=1561998 RepID=A0A1I7UWT6_9PELO